jgi:formylglycine-generating enzyme required for sulfatase activity
MRLGTLRAVALLLLAALLPSLASPQPVPAPARERRVALVIGIGAYQNAPALANPVADARNIGDALRRLDFEVDELVDVDIRRLTRGLREFGIKASRADAAVIYYAGHGVQVGRENYLLPADARLERERDLLYEALPLDLLLGEVAQAGKLGVVLLDACRNNPFVDRVSRSMTVAGRGSSGPGLARVDNVPRNTVVVMATKADQIAEDGSGAHSPFADALLAHFQIPGLELSLFFRSVRDSVLRATNNRQEPYIFSSLGADPFYFYPRPPNRPPVLAVIPPLQVRDDAGPTPLPIARPTDPDQDPMTVRIIGLPRSGEVRIEGRPAMPGAAYSTERFAAATYKPDGAAVGPMGTLDILVEDGRGGSVTGSLAVTVVASNRAPVVEAPRRLRIYTGALDVARPEDPDGDPVVVTVRGLPRGIVRNGTATLRSDDRLRPEELAALVFVPEPGFSGAAGALRYTVEDGRGGRAEGVLDVEVMDATEAAAEMAETAVWERLRATGRAEDLDLFLRLYPGSRHAAAATQRRDEMLGRSAAPSMGQAQAQAAAPRPEPAPPRSAFREPAPSAAPPGPGERLAALQPALPLPRAAPPAEPPRSAVIPPPLPAEPPRAAIVPPPLPPTPSPALAPGPAPVAPAPSAPAPDARASFQDCPTCPRMVRIPAGSFTMGQGAKDASAAPAHRVTLRAFALGQHPVTVGEWKACQAQNGCGPLPRLSVADDARPLHNTSWDDAQQYVAWLSRATGQAYRLPTEAEWEYAARAGTTTRYWWGDQPGVAQANCAECGGTQDARAPLPANTFPANPYGLYGMLGSVAQWVQDCWTPNYHGAPADGSAREARGCMRRVLRGGSFRSGRDDIAPTARNFYDAPVRYLVNGFRVARTLD